MAKTLQVISQVFPPDPAAVGWYVFDVSKAMAERGWDVHVFSSKDGYENPYDRYPSRESRDGITVTRLPFSSFGKSTMARRLVGQLSFLFQVVLKSAFGKKPTAILVSTSPPMCCFAALALRCLRKTKVFYWLMDLNPDQAIAMGAVKPTSPMARSLDWGNRRLFLAAERTVVLDSYMMGRILDKADARERVVPLPLWPRFRFPEGAPREENPFLRKHGLVDKRVLMYSGNMSPASPLDTFLSASAAFRDDPSLAFAFVGGGAGKAAVDEFVRKSGPPNVLSLPYQPEEDAPASIGAADVHLVTLGEGMSGIVHPCKVYSIMAANKPFVFEGPRPSAMADLLDRADIGWEVRNGDLAGLVEVIRSIASMSASELEKRGRRAGELAGSAFEKGSLCARFCDLIEEK